MSIKKKSAAPDWGGSGAADAGNPSARRLLQTEYMRKPIDLGPAIEAWARETYWLERMAVSDSEEQS
jgi:hypothetical protein